MAATPRPYTRQEAMVPMRDGVRLHAVILRPATVAPGERLPFLLYRTVAEDRVLQAELAGYRDYASRVRWRLLPGVW